MHKPVRGKFYHNFGLSVLIVSPGRSSLEVLHHMPPLEVMFVTLPPHTLLPRSRRHAGARAFFAQFLQASGRVGFAEAAAARRSSAGFLATLLASNWGEYTGKYVRMHVP